MTAYAIRSPLQLLTNTHYMMSELRRSTRRTSARLSEKEDALRFSGTGHAADKTTRAAQTNGGVGGAPRSGKANAHGTGATTRCKRKPAYDEEDDGFLFTRTRSKRAKPEQSVKVPEAIAEDHHQEEEKAAAAAATASRPKVVKKPRKKSVENGIATPNKKEEPYKRRRSARNSGLGNAVEPPRLEIVKKRRTKSQVLAAEQSEAVDIDAGKVVDVAAQAVVAPSPTAPPRSGLSGDTTKIALPFADTPIIRRNQEMRRGGVDGARRSSLGMRGRRASSLIDSGKSNALPHDEVESLEFFKHIESGLPEPRRMRQLLTWCGTRALADKPPFASEDGPARLAAREIQQQLLKDLSARSEMSDWFSRDDSSALPQPPMPNPKNVANLAKIQALEQQLARLQVERESWEALLRPPSAINDNDDDRNDVVVHPRLAPQSVPDPTAIDGGLLSAAGRTTLAEADRLLLLPRPPAAPASLPESTAARLRDLTAGLEFDADRLADGAHALARYRAVAGALAARVQGAAASALEGRDRRARERAGAGDEAGMRDVLRGLSRVENR